MSLKGSDILIRCAAVKPYSLVLQVALVAMTATLGTTQAVLGLSNSQSDTQASKLAEGAYQDPILKFSTTVNIDRLGQSDSSLRDTSNLSKSALLSTSSPFVRRFSSLKSFSLGLEKTTVFHPAADAEVRTQPIFGMNQRLSKSANSRDSWSNVAFYSVGQMFRLLEAEKPSSKILLVKDEQSQSEDIRPKPDKSKYNLFNPTPKEYLRDFDTDRPDKTGSPYTVDAGHIILESDLFVYTRDIDKNGTDVSTFNYLIPNLRIGLTNNIDLQINPEIYKVQHTKSKDGRSENLSGFGDTTVRLKVNFWGNDGGKTAFAAVPFVKLPTNQDGLGNRSIEGGVAFPLFVTLSDRWDIGMQTEFDVNRNQESSGYNAGFINTVSLGYKINDKLSSYFELFTNQTTEKGASFIATFDTGLKYLLTDNIQLDAGVNVGITDAADDYQPFVGLSFRF